MSPVVMLPLLLLLLLGAVLLMKREKPKKAQAAPAVEAVAAAVPAEVPAAAPVPTPAPAGDALFMVEVWQLGLLGFGVVLLLAGMAGMVTPLLGLVLVLGSVLAVVLKARAAKQ